MTESMTWKLSFLGGVVLPVNLLAAWLLQSHWPPEPLPATYPLLIGPMLLPALPLVLRLDWISALFALCIPIEVIFSCTAFHTLGALASGWHLLLVWLNIVPALLLLSRSRKRRKVALVLAGMLSLLYVPSQSAYLLRWKLTRSECRSIIEHLEAAHESMGRYPRDLSGYQFKRQQVEEFIRYNPQGADGFLLAYHIGTRSTSHCYRPDRGWSYYPD